MVRELDVSQMTLRLREKSDKKGDGGEETLAKLTGDTLGTLKQCLVSLVRSEVTLTQTVDFDR